MANHIIEAELEIAARLDHLGRELIAAGRRLHCAPWCDIKSYVAQAISALQAIAEAGDATSGGDASAAFRLLNQVESPELHLNDSEQMTAQSQGI